MTAEKSKTSEGPEQADKALARGNATLLASREELTRDERNAWLRNAAGGATTFAAVVTLVAVNSVTAMTWSGLGVLGLLSVGLGAALGVFGGQLVAWLAVANPALAERLRRSRLKVSTFEFKVGPGKVTLDLSEDDLVALWPVYVELASRISTSSLRIGDEHTGNLAGALKSLHGLFATMRRALSEAVPSGVQIVPSSRKNGAPKSAKTYILDAVSVSVRPFLARWHPWLDRWTKTGLPEERWAGYYACREDLEMTRKEVARLTQAMGQLYQQDTTFLEGDGGFAVENFSKLPQDLQVGWGEKIDMAWTGAWLEASARVPTEPVAAEPHALATVMTRWSELVRTLDSYLIQMGPIPRAARVRTNEPRPDDTVLEWRKLLEPTLIAWSTRTGSWPSVRSELPQDEVNACAEAINATRAQLLEALEAGRPGVGDRGPIPAQESSLPAPA